MQVYSVNDGLGEHLVIAENLEQAKIIFLERSELNYGGGDALEWDEVPSETSLEIHWDYLDLDPEYTNEDEFKVFKYDDNELFKPVEKTAGEWILLLGAGLLAVDMGAYRGNPSAVLYHRRCWKRSRQLPN